MVWAADGPVEYCPDWGGGDAFIQFTSYITQLSWSGWITRVASRRHFKNCVGKNSRQYLGRKAEVGIQWPSAHQRSSDVSGIHAVVPRTHAYARPLDNNLAVPCCAFNMFLLWLCKELSQNWHLHLMRVKGTHVFEKEKTTCIVWKCYFLDRLFDSMWSPCWHSF